MQILKAEQCDLHKILQLQYSAFSGEAKMLNDYSIPPLHQTLTEIEYEYANGVMFKAVDSTDKIIGSVRGFTKDNTLYIGKLIVCPKLQGRGIGRGLLDEIESLYPHHRYEIFTSSKSFRTLKIYEERGYQRFKEETFPYATIVHMEKHPCTKAT
ncbi:MAG: GNAT family N-acetyltransferase [Defluviitaleaceae bacterium]|nr:GNAT family N-acetyltransferase [Defluviitaleaceae bacterium]